MVLVYHVILQNHVIQGSCDFKQEPIKVSYHLAYLGGHKHCASGDLN